MNHFASGPKPHYYGKGDVIAYRLHRDGRTPENQSPVFGANVLMLLYGDAFWKTYTDGDNTGLIATDSMKNFIQRETMNFDGFHLEEYCRFLGGQVSRTVRPSRGAPNLSVGHSIFGVSEPCGVCAGGPRARNGTNRDESQRHPRDRVGTHRLQAAATWRQRVSRLRPRSVHDAAGSQESAIAHVARSRMALHRARRRHSQTVGLPQRRGGSSARCSRRSSREASSR